MPKKVQPVTVEPEVQEVKAVKSELCGHINKQFYNTDGQLEDLACTLPKGHAPVLIRTDHIKQADGNFSDVPVYGVIHKAEHKSLKAEIIPSLKKRVEGEKITHKEITVIGEWTDAAGTPV